MKRIGLVLICLSLVGCGSVTPVVVVRERVPIQAPPPITPQAKPLGQAIGRAETALDDNTAPAMATAVYDIRTAYDALLPQMEAYDREVLNIVADRNQTAADANAVDMARAVTGTKAPRTTAQTISAWIVALTVILSLGCLGLAGYFIYQLKFLNAGLAVAASAGVIVAGIMLSYVAIHWVWFALGGLLIIAGIGYYRWHDLIHVKVKKWLDRGSLAVDIPTLPTIAQNAAIVKAEELKPGSTVDVP